MCIVFEVKDFFIEFLGADIHLVHRDLQLVSFQFFDFYCLIVPVYLDHFHHYRVLQHVFEVLVEFLDLIAEKILEFFVDFLDMLRLLFS